MLSSLYDLNVINNAFYVTPWMINLPEPNKHTVFLTLSVSNMPCGVFLNSPKLLQWLPCKQVGRILLFIFDSVLYFHNQSTYCVDNVRRRYILINWLGLKGLKIVSEFSSTRNKIYCLLLQLPNHACNKNLMCSLSSTEMEIKKPCHAHGNQGSK